MLSRTSCSELNFEKTSKVTLDMEIKKLLGIPKAYNYVLCLFKHYVIFNELTRFQIYKAKMQVPHIV